MGELKAFLCEKVSGERQTLASWMREYVDRHPDYAHNSILSKAVMDDLLLTLNRIAKGEIIDNNFKKVFADFKPPVVT
jgi:hypothetical protein